MKPEDQNIANGKLTDVAKRIDLKTLSFTAGLVALHTSRQLEKRVADNTNSIRDLQERAQVQEETIARMGVIITYLKTRINELAESNKTLSGALSGLQLAITLLTTKIKQAGSQSFTQSEKFRVLRLVILLVIARIIQQLSGLETLSSILVGSLGVVVPREPRRQIHGIISIASTGALMYAMSPYTDTLLNSIASLLTPHM